MLLRLTLAAVSLAALHLTSWITWSALAARCAAANPDMRSLPRQLGEWISEQGDLDPDRQGHRQRIHRQPPVPPPRRKYGLAAWSCHQLHRRGAHHFPNTASAGPATSSRASSARPLQTDSSYEIPVSFSLWTQRTEHASSLVPLRQGYDLQQRRLPPRPPRPIGAATTGPLSKSSSRPRRLLHRDPPPRRLLPSSSRGGRVARLGAGDGAGGGGRGAGSHGQMTNDRRSG